MPGLPLHCDKWRRERDPERSNPARVLTFRATTPQDEFWVTILTTISATTSHTVGYWQVLAYQLRRCVDRCYQTQQQRANSCHLLSNNCSPPHSASNHHPLSLQRNQAITHSLLRTLTGLSLACSLTYPLDQGHSLPCPILQVHEHSLPRALLSLPRLHAHLPTWPGPFSPQPHPASP